MAATLRRLPRPPAGTLAAALRARAAYADCFEVALPLAEAAAPALAPAPRPALLPVLAAAPPAAAAASFRDGGDDAELAALLAGADALTAYLRAFHTSAAFAPEREAFPLMGLPPAPPVRELLDAEFPLGFRVGPFAVAHRGPVAAAAAQPLLVGQPPGAAGASVSGSEAALGWGPLRAGGDVAGLSYHAVLLRRNSPELLGGGSRRGKQPLPARELVFLFGSLLWRTPAAAAGGGGGAGSGGSGPVAVPPWVLHAAPDAAGASTDDDPPPPPRLPLAWRALLLPHRVYSRLLLAAAVDRHLRLSGLLS